MKRLALLVLALVGIFGTGCIVRFGTLYDQDDTSHFVGLASNLTNADVVAAFVQVDFFDSGNRLIATEFTTPCTRTLQDHSDAPFQVDLPSGLTADHVQTLIRPVTFGTKTVADLDVNNVAISTTDDTTHITGDIDVGNKDLFSVNVCAALLDRHGNVLKVGRDAASPSDIDSDDSGTFDVSMSSDSDARKFEIWVDAVTHNPNDVTAPVVVGPDDISSLVQDTGALSPASAVSGDWVTPENAFSNNGEVATVQIVNGAEKSEIYGDYPLDDANIPNGGTITGYSVRVDWFVDQTGGSSNVKIALSCDGGANFSDTKTSTAISTDEDHTVTLGGSDDDWGLNCDPSDLTDANFQVKITADDAADATRTFSLDWIPVTVFYTED